MAPITMVQYDQHAITTHPGVGAMLEKSERLLRHAKQCRALADSAITAEAREVLLDMALDYENRAATLQVSGVRSLAPTG